MKSFSINKPNTQEKTIIVIGTARSGTSIVGSILYHAGVYMGELTNKKQYEDSALIMNGGDIRNFNKVPETRRSILKHKAAIINERNIKYKTWGWKDPNVVWYYKYINNVFFFGVFILVIFIIQMRFPICTSYINTNVFKFYCFFHFVLFLVL